MAQSTIQAIKEAELAADKALRDAAQKKDELLKNADIEAKKIIADQTKAVKEKAEADLAEANKKKDEVVSEAVVKTEANIKAMRENAQAKKKQAIDLIVAEVI